MKVFTKKFEKELDRYIELMGSVIAPYLIAFREFTQREGGE